MTKRKSLYSGTIWTASRPSKSKKTKLSGFKWKIGGIPLDVKITKEIVEIDWGDISRTNIQKSTYYHFKMKDDRTKVEYGGITTTGKNKEDAIKSFKKRVKERIKKQR